MKANSDIKKIDLEEIFCFMPLIIFAVFMIVVVIGLLSSIYIQKNPKEEPKIIGTYFSHYRIIDKQSKSFTIIDNKERTKNISVGKHCDFNNLFYHYYNSDKFFTVTYNTYRYVDFFDSLKFYDRPEKDFEDLFCD
jgi:hypothetical protein